MVGTEDVTCDGDQPGVFASKDVGTWTVSATGLAIAGADSGNYILDNATDDDTADITAKHLTAAITAADKIYDGTTDAAYSCALTGVVGTEDVTCDGDQPGVFASKDVGTWTVSATGLAIAGADSGNYILDNATDDDTADITAKHLTAAITAADKIYDGTTDAAYSCALTGVVGTEDVTCDGDQPGVFASKDVGTWTVSATGLAIAGADSGNYILDNATDDDTADISPAGSTSTVVCPAGPYTYRRRAGALHGLLDEHQHRQRRRRPDRRLRQQRQRRHGHRRCQLRR